MNSKLIKGALTFKRNIWAAVIAFVGLASVVPQLPFGIGSVYRSMILAVGAGTDEYRMPLAFAGALAVYAGFVIQSLASDKFHEDYEIRSMVSEVRKMSEEYKLSSRNLKRKLEPDAQQRLTNMTKEAGEIVQSFLNGDKNPLKLRIVKQSLKLTSNYIKLADMFRQRSIVSDGEHISALARRINQNTGNLNAAREQGVADELKRVIEADEKMIESLKNERIELEKIDARLQYMESAISMLKYNIISNIESEDILSNLESDVAETDALNSVLTDRFDERRETRRVRL